MSGVSVIIVTHDGRDLLRACLRSLLASDAAGEEIVIVDNDSHDGTAAMLRDEFPGVRCLLQERNLGFAEANNAGAAAAGGELLVFLNNDTVVEPGWLAPLRAALDGDPGAAAAGSKLLFLDRPGVVNSAGASIVFNGGGYDIGCGDRDGPRYDVPGPRGALCAAAMMVRRPDFFALGGFDPRYFMYFEDVDFCWRCQLLGRRLLYVPGSVVRHLGGASAGRRRFTPLRARHGTRNAILTAWKNYEGRHLPFPLVFNVLFAAAKALYLAFTLRPAAAAAVLGGLGSALRLLPSFRTSRAGIQGRRVRSDRFLRREGYLLGPAAAAGAFLRRLRRRSLAPAGRGGRDG